MEETITVTIGNEPYEIKPLRGMRSIRMMPKIISIGTELLYGAVKNGVPIDKWFLSDGTEATITFSQIMMALNVTADILGERFKDFEEDVVPFLLQKPHKWLQDNGTPREIFTALWQAVQFHIKTSFGEDTLEALKKSVDEEMAGAQEETVSEIQEQ